MARKQNFKSEDGNKGTIYVQMGSAEYSHIWGIDDAVGWGCANDEFDVLLVQYLLNKSSSATGHDTLVTDGLFGNKTAAAVRAFQKGENRQFKGICHVDGRVDPFKGRNVSTISKTVYAIIMLNFEMAAIRPVYFLNPAMDPDLPVKLLDVLKP
ncbi:MAG TPA: peptidoglycan-binding domain-containing protein [Aridibacter sp.]|nr:peptidoglycan-binding domain-containing protein [Aridibacter sp.]